MKLTGVCSLYANPPHAGHLDYIDAAIAWIARKQQDLYYELNYEHYLGPCHIPKVQLATEICIVVNNDIQVRLKKSCPFYDEKFRATLLKRIYPVSITTISISYDSSVAPDLEMLGQSTRATDRLFFFNSGDRDPKNWNERERVVCEKFGIETVFLDLPKVNSSSKLILEAAKWTELNFRT